MVKFKMKLLLVLAACAFTTITFIFYVSSLSDCTGVDLLYLPKKKLERFMFVSSNSSSEYGVVPDIFNRNRLLRNPMSSFSIEDTSQSSLVGTLSKDNESTAKGEHNLIANGSSSSYNNLLKAIESRAINQMPNRDVIKQSTLSPMYNIVSFVNNATREFVSIPQGAVKVRSIQHLIDNKTVLSEFQSRREVMLRECSKAYTASSVLHLKKDKFEHILVDVKNKLLFCYIPKVACTNWKRMFMLLSGKSDNTSYVTNLPSYEIHAKNMFFSLQNYSAVEIDFFVRNYTKFIFVRNPLERLLSAYRNKLEQHYNSSKYFQARFGKYIVKNFRANPNNNSLLKGDDVTFTEFVKYLVSSAQAQYNEHWQTMNDLCHPCFMKYDIIGKYDSLLSDSKAVLNMFHANYSFPTLPKPSRTASSLKQYYKQLPSDLIQKLKRIYEMDFQLFSYSIEETLGF